MKTKHFTVEIEMGTGGGATIHVPEIVDALRGVADDLAKEPLKDLRPVHSRTIQIKGVMVGSWNIFEEDV